MDQTIQERKTFSSQTVLLDGTRFIRCEFVDCTLLYRGGGWSFEECNVIGQCRVDFSETPSGEILAFISCADGKISYSEPPRRRRPSPEELSHERVARPRRRRESST